jgi:ABC-type uncharacterized transport system auxiliary subunit
MKKLPLTLILCASLCGCAGNKAGESFKVELKSPSGATATYTWTSEVGQNLFLYFTKTKAIDHRTIFSSLTVGEIVQEPDPNSIEALGGALGNAGKMLIKP